MNLLGRRRFLAGLGLGAGAHLLGSIWKAMAPEALGAAAIRKRFILFTNANGFLVRNYTCQARSETDFDLTPALQPLAPFKQDLIVASKFYNPFDKALHGNQYATLSVMPSPNQSGEKRGPPGGISIDRLLARRIGAQDPFPSTAVGVSDKTNVPCLSADGLNQKFPAIGNPVRAYQAYFAGGSMGAGVDAAKLLAADKSLLDFVVADATRMNARLAGPERAKLDQYLTSLRGVERQLSELARSRTDCKQPPAPDPGTAHGQIDPKVVSGLVEVTFAAQLCGLTHVSHISILGMEGPHNRYGWLGDSRGHHNSMHADDRAVIERIDTFVMSRVAQLADNLRRVGLLDSSLIMYLNCCGGAHHRGHDTHAVVLVGKAGGRLRTGRYVSLPQGKHCLSDVYVSAANALDVPITTFGAPEHCKGPLAALS